MKLQLIAINLNWQYNVSGVCWLVGESIGWLVGESVGWLMEESVGWLVGKSVGCQPTT